MEWHEHLAAEPGIRPYLEALARKALRAGAMPRQATLGDVPADAGVRRRLDFIFGGCSVRDGRLVAKLADRLQSPDSLAALATNLGLAPESAAPRDDPGRLATAVMRQGLLFPSFAPWLAAAAAAGELRSLFRDDAVPERTLNGLLQAVAFLAGNRGAITLSQLGAQTLNDSKALRSGALRALLGKLLARQVEALDETPDAVLSRCGVIENPYTTGVLLFGPVVYEDSSGRVWDWPARLHAAGQAAALTWEHVQGIRALRPAAAAGGVITSENAAPFHHLVECRTAAIVVYTAGYPNAAVTRLLSLLAAAGLVARHWGDTDLDGLRIAEWVARAIPVELYRQDSATLMAHASRLMPLTELQRTRAQAYLAAHPAFPFRATLEFTLQHGWLEQEQTVGRGD